MRAVIKLEVEGKTLFETHIELPTDDSTEFSLLPERTKAELLCNALSPCAVIAH